MIGWVDNPPIFFSNYTITIRMKTFEEYLDKMGYGWNDFDRTYEMKNFIEQYANERVKQALTIPAVVRRSEQLVCACGNKLIDKEIYFGQCLQCDANVEE